MTDYLEQSVAETTARLKNENYERSTGTFSLVQMWEHVDPTLVDTLTASLDVDDLTNPIASGQTYTGKFAVSRVWAEEDDERYGIIYRELTKVNSVDNISELSSLTAVPERRNEIEEPFGDPVAPRDDGGTPTPSHVHEGESDYLKLTYFNLDTDDREAFMGITDAQMVSLGSGYGLDTGGWVYITRTFDKQKNGTSTGVILLAEKKWNEGYAEGDAIILSYTSSVAGDRAVVRRVWPRRSREAKDALIGSGAAVSDSTALVKGSSPDFTSHIHQDADARDNRDGSFNVIQTLIGVHGVATTAGNFADFGKTSTVSNVIEDPFAFPNSSTRSADEGESDTWQYEIPNLAPSLESTWNTLADSDLVSAFNGTVYIQRAWRNESNKTATAILILADKDWHSTSAIGNAIKLVTEHTIEGDTQLLYVWPKRDEATMTALQANTPTVSNYNCVSSEAQDHRDGSYTVRKRYVYTRSIATATEFVGAAWVDSGNRGIDVWSFPETDGSHDSDQGVEYVRRYVCRFIQESDAATLHAIAPNTWEGQVSGYAFVGFDFQVNGDTHVGTGVLTMVKKTFFTGTTEDDALWLGGKYDPTKDVWERVERCWPRRDKAAYDTLMTGGSGKAVVDMATNPGVYAHGGTRVVNHGDGSYSIYQTGNAAGSSWTGKPSSTIDYFIGDSYIEKRASINGSVKSGDPASPVDGYFWRTVVWFAKVRITDDEDDAATYVFEDTTNGVLDPAAPAALIGSKVEYIGSGLFKATRIIKRTLGEWRSESLRGSTSTPPYVS